jgi:hypothetical protein
MSIRLLVALGAALLIGTACPAAQPQAGGKRPAIAVPEPELLALFALGVAGLAAGRVLARRRGGR